MEKAKVIFQSEKIYLDLARAYGNLGIVEIRQGNKIAAKQNYQKAREIFENLNDTLGLATFDFNTSYSYLVSQDGEGALPYILRSLEYYKSVQNSRLISMNLGNLAYAYSLMEDYPKACSGLNT